jgi:membrane protein
VALAVFVVLALVFVVGGGDLAAWVARMIGAGDLFAGIWSLVQWAIALTLVVLAVDLVYYFAPNADNKWVWVTPGSVLATALWLVASAAFKLYIENFGSYTAVHGAIGTIIVLMLWFYLSGFALLVGAELNAEIDKAIAPHRPRGRSGRRAIGPAAEYTDRT